MSRPIRIFLYFSAAAHLVFFAAAGLVVVEAALAPDPIRVTLYQEPAPEVENDIATGEIMDLPAPPKEETPQEADILSKWDSAAHSPEKGEKNKSTTRAVPREKINPPAPSKEKSKFEIVPKKETPRNLQVAALSPPEKTDTTRKENAVNVFSDVESSKKVETEASRHYQKGPELELEKHQSISSAVTDKPDKPKDEKERLTGMENAKGNDLDEYASNAEKDVIDMGDEAVVSFNTRAFGYVDYFNTVREAVDLAWEYPEEAVLGGLSGRVKMLFTLRRDGKLMAVKVLKSTGHKSLDDSAKSALILAGPFAPFPTGLAKKRIHVVAEFRYQPSFHALR